MKKIHGPEIIGIGEHLAFTSVLSNNMSTIIDRIAEVLKIKDPSNLENAFDLIRRRNVANLVDIHQFTNQGIGLIEEFGYERIQKGEVTFHEFYQALEMFIEDFQNSNL